MRIMAVEIFMTTEGRVISRLLQKFFASKIQYLFQFVAASVTETSSCHSTGYLKLNAFLQSDMTDHVWSNM